MSLDDSRPPHEEVHRGHDLESGLLTRVREWVDLFPWIRLGRTLRAVGSPPLLLVVAMTFALWQLGQTLILGQGPIESPLWLDVQWLSLQDENDFLWQFLHQTNSTAVYDMTVTARWWMVLASIAWTVVAWAPAGILLTRQGGCLTAGRPMMSLRDGLSHAIRRSPSAWLSSFVPLACVFAIALAIAILGWLAQWSSEIRVIEIGFGLLAAILATPCGILAFGANVAVPLSWAALANEKHPDTLDSLSRGYEYLFRRPLQLVLYVIVGVVILWIVRVIASGIAITAISVSTKTMMFCGAPRSASDTSAFFLAHLPAIMLLTATWTLIGGIYLLLRYDAGGQEVEDLWTPELQPSTPLPELPSSP